MIREHSIERSYRNNLFCRALLLQQNFFLTQSKVHKKEFIRLSFQYLKNVEKRKVPWSLYSGLCGGLWLTGILPTELSRSQKNLRDKYHNQIVKIIQNFDSKQIGSDLVSGWVGIGIYLLARKDHNSDRYVNLIIAHLEKSRIKTKFGYQWVSIKDGKPVIDLGIPHGCLGIVIFLSYCVHLNLQRARCMRMIRETIDFLIEVNKQSPELNFPSFVPSTFKTRNRTQAWCYGNLALGFTLVTVGKNCRNKKWLKIGLDIFEKNSKKIKSNEVTDAYICHGTSGVLRMCERVSTMSKGQFPLNNVRIWHKKTNDLFKRHLEGEVFVKYSSGWFYDFTGTQLVLNSHGHENVIWDSFLLLSMPRRNN